eukprot:3931616-Rhodomonas_salina.1
MVPPRPLYQQARAQYYSRRTNRYHTVLYTTVQIGAARPYHICRAIRPEHSTAREPSSVGAYQVCFTVDDFVHELVQSARDVSTADGVARYISRSTSVREMAQEDREGVVRRQSLLRAYGGWPYSLGAPRTLPYRRC